MMVETVRYKRIIKRFVCKSHLYRWRNGETINKNEWKDKKNCIHGERSDNDFKKLLNS